jgi:hypothetical protein
VASKSLKGACCTITAADTFAIFLGTRRAIF